MNLCDPESFLPVITECLNEEQRKVMRPEHMANFLALSAELFLTNFDGIAAAFEKQNGLELNFKAKLAQEKDTVDISYKPVEVYKDSASLNLPDPDQETMPFMKKGNSSAPPAEPEPVVVEAEILELPAPLPEVLSLPSPQRTEGEQDAYSEGQAAAASGIHIEDNPYAQALNEEAEAYREAWNDGYRDQQREQREADEAGNADSGEEIV